MYDFVFLMIFRHAVLNFETNYYL